jgi:hypothetical protein
MFVSEFLHGEFSKMSACKVVSCGIVTALIHIINKCSQNYTLWFFREVNMKIETADTETEFHVS